MYESLVFYYNKSKENELKLLNFMNEKYFKIAEEIHFFLFESLFLIIKNTKIKSDIEFLMPKIILDIIKPVNITDKKLIEFFFNCNFSDNLIEMYINGDEEYEFFEKQLINGEGLNYTFEFKKVLNIKSVSFEYIKLQPKFNNYVITLRNKNLLQFNKNLDIKEIFDFVEKFNSYYENYLTEGNKL